MAIRHFKHYELRTPWCYNVLLTLCNVVYIGMCDWGEAGHLQEVSPSLYGFVKEHDVINAKKNALVNCPKIVISL